MEDEETGSEESGAYCVVCEHLGTDRYFLENVKIAIILK